MSTLRARIRRFSPFVALGLLLYVVLFWRLGEASFWDPDEAHYAETSRELLHTGDWLAPHYNGQPFVDKPVFFHWLQALSMMALGPTELAARLAPAVAALVLVGVTWWLGRVLGSNDVGFVAALLLGTSPALFGLARYAILDTVFTALLFGGTALVAVAALADRPRLQYGGYGLIALAVLTKGPLALTLCGIAFALAITLSSDARRRLLALQWIVGLALVLGASAPWFVYMWRRFGDAFVQGYVLSENLTLFSRPVYGNQPPWWFYFQILAAGLLPWTSLLVGRGFDAARAWWRERHLPDNSRQTPDTFELLLWCWVAAVVGFFTFSRFKLDHYVFPAAPALALLCARAWTDQHRQDGEALAPATRLGLRLVGPILVTVGLGAGVFMIARLGLPPLAYAVPIALSAAGAVITMRVTVRGMRPPRAPWMAVSALGVTYASIVATVIPSLEQGKVVPDVAAWIGRQAGDHRVGSYHLNRWSGVFRFYVDRPVAVLETAEETRRFFESPEPFYCAMMAPAVDEFVAQAVPLQVVYAREGISVTSGRALWRRRERPAQFVVVTRAARAEASASGRADHRR